MCLMNVMPTTNAVKEISSKLNIRSTGPMIRFELKIAKDPILTPRTNHIALEHHNFRFHVEDGSISIEAISTGEQNVDT